MNTIPDTLSTEHLRNVQKIIDEMALHSARLVGGFEALRMLYPDIVNNDYHDFVTAAYGYAGDGMPFSSKLAVLSRRIQKELEGKS